MHNWNIFGHCIKHGIGSIFWDIENWRIYGVKINYVYLHLGISYGDECFNYKLKYRCGVKNKLCLPPFLGYVMEINVSIIN